MSTAEKLTYLATTKSKIKDSINSLGGNITSQTTFRQYATELDSIYSSLPKVNGTGSILSLSPTLKGRLGSVLKGNTLQDGTPTPDSPVEIQSATGLQKVSVEGKNLLDTQYFENGSIDGTTGQNVSAPYNARGNNYISVIPNTTYTISSNAILTNLRLSEYTKEKTNIQRDVISNNNKLTITTTANTYYLRWSLNYNNSTEITQQIIDSLDLQLEKGQATTYEPYQSQTKELNLGTIKLNKIGDYQDYITGSPDNWSIKRQVADVIFDGTENEWAKSSNQNVDRYYINTNLYKNDANSKCNYFTKGGVVETVGIWTNNVNTQLLFNFAEAGTTTLQDWKNWLSTHNLELVQPLITETTEAITNQEIINQLNEIYNLQSYNGTTNITITSEDLELIMTASAIKGE